MNRMRQSHGLRAGWLSTSTAKGPDASPSVTCVSSGAANAAGRRAVSGSRSAIAALRLLAAAGVLVSAQPLGGSTVPCPARAGFRTCSPFSDLPAASFSASAADSTSANHTRN